MGRHDDRETHVHWVLDELCIRMGICLPPEESRRLRESPPGGVDSFTDAVLEAEGLDGITHPDLRRRVREVVDRRLSRWMETGVEQPEITPGEGSWSPH